MAKGYRSEAFSFNRTMVAAAAAVTARKSTFHSMAQAEVTHPRRMIREHYEKTGEKLSFSAYILYCLARALSDHPHLNAFRKRNRLILLEDLTLSIQVEREFLGEKVPEPLCIHRAQERTYREISELIRGAQADRSTKMGRLTGMAWIRFIPGFLLRTFIRIADRNIRMARKYGKIGVTAVGMFSREPLWFIPHGSGTVLVTVGSIEQRGNREFLCLTVSFDHEVVDGSPAARFMNQFLETLKSAMTFMEKPL